jgi:hypothetical protein
MDLDQAPALMPDGSIKHLHVVARVWLEERDTLQFVGAVIDITETTRAEKEVQRMFGLAVKPQGYSWLQPCWAGALSGIGFTTSLIIAIQASPEAADFEAAQITAFIASLSAVIGLTLLWIAGLAPQKEGKPSCYTPLTFSSYAWR